MKRPLFLIFFATYMLSGIAQNYSISFENLSVREGLSQNSVIRIFQDSNFFMWFCTRDGLNKYDGSTFEVYRTVPGDDSSISSSDITTIAETRDGKLWVGTHYGLNILDPQTNRFTRLYHGAEGSVSGNIIKHLFVDRYDQLWVATTVGLDRYDKETGTFRNISRGKPIVWITEDSYGNFCYTDGDSLFFL